MTRRCGARAVGIALTVLMTTAAAPAFAAGEGDQVFQPAGDAKQTKAGDAAVKKTPKRALDWYQKQLDRMEQQRRAVEVRRHMMQQGGGQSAEPAQ